MVTRLYLVRHGATDANLIKPYRLQGRYLDTELAPTGVRQAELTKDALKSHRFDHYYSSPLKRAFRTAEIIAEPHGASVEAIADLAECDVGEWEGLTWETIERDYAETYHRFMSNPAEQGYPGGESFADVTRRVVPIFEGLLQQHHGDTLLVVGHHVVNRVYLASLMGLSPARAREVKLDNCGISIIECSEGQSRVIALNQTEHLVQMNAME